MFDEPRRGDAGPWECPACGTRLNAPLVFCPACGANRLAMPSAVAAGGKFAPDERARGVADRLRALWGALPAGFGSAGPFGDEFSSVEYEPVDEGKVVHRSRLPLYVGGVLMVLAAVVAAFAVAPHSEWEPIPGVQIIEGTVGAPQGATPPASGGAASAEAEADLALRNGFPPAAGGYGTRGAAQGSLKSGHVSGNAVPASNGDTNARSRVARELAIARSNLGRNSLWPARRAIMSALAAQPGNSGAQQMQAELAPREQERDSLLGHARQCARAGQWGCVREYARRAASVDTSSREAKRLLARAHVGRGDAVVQRHGNGGDTVAQRYSSPDETVVQRYGNPGGTVWQASGSPGLAAAQRDNTDLLARLHRWFERSIAQAQMKPQRQPQPWDRP